MPRWKAWTLITLLWGISAFMLWCGTGLSSFPLTVVAYWLAVLFALLGVTTFVATNRRLDAPIDLHSLQSVATATIVIRRSRLVLILLAALLLIVYGGGCALLYFWEEIRFSTAHPNSPAMHAVAIATVLLMTPCLPFFLRAALKRDIDVELDLEGFNDQLSLNGKIAWSNVVDVRLVRPEIPTSGFAMRLKDRDSYIRHRWTRFFIAHGKDEILVNSLFLNSKSDEIATAIRRLAQQEAW